MGKIRLGSFDDELRIYGVLEKALEYENAKYGVKRTRREKKDEEEEDKEGAMDDIVIDTACSETVPTLSWLSFLVHTLHQLYIINQYLLSSTSIDFVHTKIFLSLWLKN